ncbi:MAG: RDD family protein [Xenococcaceae cyanobacterium]
MTKNNKKESNRTELFILLRAINMYSDKPVYRRFPKVPIERRAGAFLIDFVAVWLLSAMAGNNILLQGLIFIISWLVSRVVISDKNQGQSLGRWALDMKIIDARYNRTPDLLTLVKREGIVGSAAFLAMIGLNMGLGLSLLLLIAPLAADCAIALADDEYCQAFHDRLSETYVVQTQRGFSLDLRLKKIFLQVKRNFRK